MGRFETAVEFYRYREPYPPAFFEAVAERLSLGRKTRLLDVGCGPGNLAIGFAPLVGSCWAIDPEPEMLSAARAAAREANVQITFLEGAIEDLAQHDGAFDLVTIGRALHWLAREATLGVLERIVAAGGRIAICGSLASDAPVNEWEADFKKLRRAWASDPDEARYKVDLDQWFAKSRFRKIEEISVRHRNRLTVRELVGRALSYSITSPAVIQERRPQFEAEVMAVLEPFARDGAMEEELIAKATVFG